MTTQQEGRDADGPVALEDWDAQEVGAFAEIKRMPAGLAESGLGEHQTREAIDVQWDDEMKPARIRPWPDVWRQAA